MSHRKFEHPRQGHLGYLPKRRTKHTKGKIRSFPRDDKTQPVHLTAFMGYKAGMTHIVRMQEKREGKKTVKKDIVEPVTVVETPPIKVVGMVGYIETPRGLRALSTVWAQHLPAGVIRRFYKNYYIAKKRAFARYAERYTKDKGSKQHVERDIQRIANYSKLSEFSAPLKSRSASLDKERLTLWRSKSMVEMLPPRLHGPRASSSKRLLSERSSPTTRWSIPSPSLEVRELKVSSRDSVSPDFQERPEEVSERSLVSVPGIHLQSSGLSLELVTSVTITEPRSTKRSTVGAGAVRGINNNASTEADAHVKNITPIGGFPHYGIVNEDFLLLRGNVGGPRKRQITIRKTLVPQTSSFATHKLEVKFIDTASKIGHGKFQTLEEKDRFLGPLASKQKE